MDNDQSATPAADSRAGMPLIFWFTLGVLLIYALRPGPVAAYCNRQGISIPRAAHVIYAPLSFAWNNIEPVRWVYAAYFRMVGSFLKSTSFNSLADGGPRRREETGVRLPKVQSEESRLPNIG